MQNEDGLHLDGVMEKEETFRKMEQCLEGLPGMQKTAIRQFYIEGRCYNEIAENMGQDWNQIRSFVQNGRRNLKICMDSKKEQNSNIDR